MPNAKPRRRPPLLSSSLCFLPSLAAVAIAAFGPHPFALLPLLIAGTLCMAAVCHAIGFDSEPSFVRTLLRRGPAHLILLAIYAAVVFVLIAWPLLVLSQSPSLIATFGLCVALVLALAVLWRLWPVFGLVFVWDDAFPAGAEHSWITTAMLRSATFAGHLTRDHDVFFSHFLPGAMAQLAIVFGALVLAGAGAVLPDEMRTAALFLYAILWLPLCTLVVVNRTVRLVCGRRGGKRAEIMPDDTPPPAASPTPTRKAPAVPAAEQVEPAPESAPPEPPLPQATLDQGLLDAARHGDVATALQWLDRGADPDATPPAGARDQRSALVLAAELPDTRLLRALIAKGADVNRANAGLTALLAATRSCRNGRPETVMTLLANGADPGLADAEGNTPLHHAALCTEPTVAAILIDAQAPLEALNRHHATPLAMAAAAGNWPLLRFLLERGARPDAALPAAASVTDDDPEGVRILLRHRARVDAADALGRTALMHAAREGHVQIVATLIEAGANVNASDHYGTTALMEAARAGTAATLRLLAEAQPDVRATDKHGRDALTLACQSPRANPDCVRTLLALGADPLRRGGDGRSAVEQAVAAGRWDLVALLDPDAPLPASLAQAAQPEAGADTPAHLLDALRFGHWNVVSGFAERARSWPMSELAALFLDLSDLDDAGPRRWLLEHGLDPEARLDDGTRMFDAVLERLPVSLGAARQLLDAGAVPTGAGALARALSRLTMSPEAVPLALELLSRGADAFGADADGRTPLHHAACAALQPLLRELLARGADPNARDHRGATPLHVALNDEPSAALPLVRMLIAHGADPEAAAASGETPLGLALARGDHKLEFWLRWNGWPLPGRPLREDDLPAAAADADAVARLLELGMPVNSHDERGASALLRAAGSGHLRSVQRLLAAGADPGLTADSGASPLSAAVSGRHGEIVRTLVAGGARVDQRLAGDVTALMVAAALGLPDMVETLLECGAKPELADERGHTALHAAARFCFDSRDSLRCRRLLDALLDGHAPVDTVDAAQATPLLLLLGVHARPGRECDGTHLGALLPVLLDAGAALDHADVHGVTALHACAMHALFEPARVLMARGADREARDCMERTPADVARVLGYVDLAMELAPRVPSPAFTTASRQPVPHPE